MYVAVCDDLPEALDSIRELLNQIAFVDEIHLFLDMENFFDTLKENTYDAVLLDIDWKKEETGIDLAEKLLKESPDTRIIYMTAYTAEYAEEIFLKDSNLSGFLMKPVRLESLRRNLEKVQKQKYLEEGVLIIRQKGTILRIPFRDIYYMENQLHKTRIVLKDKEYLCNESLEQVKRQLNKQFLTVHKSYVVNMKQIREFGNGEVLLNGNIYIPVSKKKYSSAKSHFFSYVSENL